MAAKLEEQKSVGRWCRAVGGPVLTAPERPAATPMQLKEFVVVVWNLHAGEAALESFVAALRSGELTGGRPVDHFVLLLQEALRTGPALPEPMPADARAAPPVNAIPLEDHDSIEKVASRTGLYAFYAPSMRNGEDRLEDRGNAILATFELDDPTAIVLPQERQRRVSVAATIEVPTGAGILPIRVVSVHFENWSKWSRLFKSFGSGRARQARAILAEVSRHEVAIVGGDFNTWFQEEDEEAIRILQAHLPTPQDYPASDTYSPPFALPVRQVDYLMWRLPEGWRGEYGVTEDLWESDHAPLIGWIELPTPNATKAPQ